MAGEEGVKENGGGDAQQRLDSALEELGKIKADNETLKGATSDLERKLDDADKELLSENYLKFKEGSPSGDGERGGKESAVKEGGIDLDQASNKEIVEYVEGRFGGNIKQAMEGLDGRLKKSDERISIAFAQIDVAISAMKHDGRDGKPGFTDNQDAIFKIAKDNPSWGADKCYGQFLLEKTKSDNDSAAEKKMKAEEDEKSRTEKGGAGVPGSTTQEKELSKEEAAELAYKKGFGNQEK